MQCEDRASSYSFGWSHGKEAIEDGRADLLKGSYYNNPLQDNRHSSAALMAEFPCYCRCVVAPGPTACHRQHGICEPCLIPARSGLAMHAGWLASQP